MAYGGSVSSLRMAKISAAAAYVAARQHQRNDGNISVNM